MIDGRVLTHGARVGVKLNPRLGTRLAVVACAAGAGVGVCGVAMWGRRNRLTGLQNKPYKLSQTLVDALCGAAGEVTALVALYPLDTVKTLCQARNVGAGVVVKELLALGPGKMMCAAYAGIGQAALGSLLLGALYLMTFYGVSRFGKRAFAMVDSWSQGKSAIVASTAGAMASIVGSLIEAPVESLKIRAQAGWGVSCPRNAFNGGGWYQGMAFFPYLFKAVPNDVAELFTYSQLHDLTKPYIHVFGCEKVDAMVGAASGAVATVVSMPFDVIFTRMNVLGHFGADGRNKSITALLGAFWTTAATTCKHGTRACFVGLVPRLLQTVPAGMIYWMAVEATRRALETQFDVREQ